MVVVYRFYVARKRTHIHNKRKTKKGGIFLLFTVKTSKFDEQAKKKKKKNMKQNLSSNSSFDGFFFLRFWQYTTSFGRVISHFQINVADEKE